MFYGAPFVECETIEEVVVQSLFGKVPMGEIRSSFLPPDIGLRDDPHPFDDPASPIECS